MKKFGLIALSAIVIGSFSMPAFATTLSLASTGGASAGGEQIYPYNMSVNGSSSTLAMMCLDANRSIQQGEVWNVTQNSIPTGNSTTAIDYRALALIFANIQTGAHGISAADYQFAAWSIFDPAITSSSAYTPTAAIVAATALADAAKPGFNFNYTPFSYYAPTSDTTGWTNGIPQEFMTGTPDGPNVPKLGPSPVPEPSSLMMFGTGLLGAASMVRRRIKRAS